MLLAYFLISSIGLWSMIDQVVQEIWHDREKDKVVPVDIAEGWPVAPVGGKGNERRP